MKKTILITGSTDGIGRETARVLAKEGHRVILHGRSRGRAQAAREALRREAPAATVDYVVGDFASLDQVRRLAEDVQKRFGGLSVLINNAGVYLMERRLSADGFELTFAVNHLAPFLLTALLADVLKKNAPARIVNVTSTAHRSGHLDLSDLQSEKSFDGYHAYAASKLANALFTFELAERLRGTGVTVNCVHPGVINTKLLIRGFGAVGEEPAEGARGPAYLAVSPEVEKFTGVYFEKDRPAEPSADVRDRSLREGLWKASVEMISPPIAITAVPETR
jgi:NAD(P)-dependent dehydrogenase (short-subunit alcohol dehydrogenase family)